MRKATMFCIAALVALAFVALGTTGESYAEKRAVPEKTKTITITGTFNGSLNGQIAINGRKVSITKRTMIRSVTSGDLKLGHSVRHKPVYVNAVLDRHGQLHATLVVVNDSRRRNGGELKELESDAAQ